MARYLQQLLGAKEPLFSAGMQRLEKATGNNGIDAKLIGDIHTHAYAAMRKMGLDPANTTTRELWAALQGNYPKDAFKHTDYSGLVTVDGVISFNENDVKRNHSREFSKRTLDTMRIALTGEIADRYMATGRDTGVHIRELMHDAGLKTLNLLAKQKVKGTKK